MSGVPLTHTPDVAQEFVGLVTDDTLVCETMAGGIERYTVLEVRRSPDWPSPLTRLAFEETDQVLDYWVTYHDKCLVGVYGRHYAGKLWWVTAVCVEKANIRRP